MNIDHNGHCLCEAFGFSHEQVDRMRTEVAEILSRSENLSEALELAHDLGKTDEEKCFYSYLFGRVMELKVVERDLAEKGLPPLEALLEGKAVISGKIPKSLESLLKNIFRELGKDRDQE